MESLRNAGPTVRRHGNSFSPFVLFPVRLHPDELCSFALICSDQSRVKELSRFAAGQREANVSRGAAVIAANSTLIPAFGAETLRPSR